MDKSVVKHCCIVILFFVVGCSSGPSTSTLLSPTIPPLTSTPVYLPTPTQQPTTATPEPTLTPTPGANLGVLFLADGGIQSYNLQSWSKEKLGVQSDGDILQAALSPDDRWLAFQDKNGLKIVEEPFTGQPTRIPAVLSDQMHFVFSFDDKALAYSDAEGLKIFSLADKTSSLLLRHVTDQSDVSRLRHYFPRQWSPNGEWLWIDVGHWEGVSRILAHMSTRTFHEYSGCYSDADWLQTSAAFVAAVRYSGYMSCGENDGIYLIELGKDGKIADEKRIFQESVPAEPWARAPQDVALNPDGKELAFVQVTNPEQPFRSSRLVLVNLRTGQHQDMDTSQKDITSPLWTHDGKRLFYTIQGKENSQVIGWDLDTGSRHELSTFASAAEVISSLPDDRWLVVGTVLNQAWDGLYLVNTRDGSVLKMSDLGYDTHISPLIGAMPRY